MITAIARDEYLSQPMKRRFDGMLKVVTGIRRCGKFYLLNNIYRKWLHEQGVTDDQIIFIGLDELRNLRYCNPITLAAEVRRRVTQMSCPMYLFIDEIQMSDTVPSPTNPGGAAITFYDALNDLRPIPNLDITITAAIRACSQRTF